MVTFFLHLFRWILFISAYNLQDIYIYIYMRRGENILKKLYFKVEKEKAREANFNTDGSVFESRATNTAASYACVALVRFARPKRIAMRAHTTHTTHRGTLSATHYEREYSVITGWALTYDTLECDHINQEQYQESPVTAKSSPHTGFRAGFVGEGYTLGHRCRAMTPFYLTDRAQMSKTHDDIVE